MVQIVETKVAISASVADEVSRRFALEKVSCSHAARESSPWMDEVCLRC
jgi:hypothetical protein